MKHLAQTLILLLASQNAWAAWPAAIQGQNDAATKSAQQMLVPYNQVTSVGAKTLIETGNDNALVNPGFEASSIASPWVATKLSGTTFTAAVDAAHKKGAQSALLTFTAATGEFSQDTTSISESNNMPMVAGCWIKTTLTDVKVCPRTGGSDYSAYCSSAAVSGGNWTLVVSQTFPGPANGTSVGVGVENSNSETGTANADECFVGSANVAQQSSPATGYAGTDAIAYTPSFSAGFGSVTAISVFYRREGNFLYASGSATLGVTATSIGSISLPSGLSIDTSVITVGNTTSGAGVSVGSISVFGANNSSPLVTATGTDATKVYVGNIPASSSNPNIPMSSLNGTWGSGANSTAFSFWFRVPISGWSSNVQVAPSSTFWISSYLANGTRVTGSAPTALGQYRSRYKSASSSNTLTDVAPTTAPSSSNGVKLDAANYASAQTSGLISYYDIFIGKNKNWSSSFFSTTGRTGPVSPTYAVVSSTAANGTRMSYDPGTGVVTVEAGIADLTTNTTRTIGVVPETGGSVSSGYFDIQVSDNALFVASSVTGPGSVTSTSTGQEHTERFSFGGSGGSMAAPTSCTTGSCTIYKSSFSPTVTWNSTGNYTFGFPSGEYAGIATCQITPTNWAGASAGCNCNRTAGTSTSLTYQCICAGSSQNIAADVQCEDSH